MKKAKVLGVAAIAMSALLLASCASSGEGGEKKGKAKKLTDQDYLESLNAGDYTSCLSYLENRNAKKETDDIIRDLYDEAMIKHFQKDYEGSIALLNDTDKRMHDSVTKSISQGVGAAALNENIADYSGTPYEYIYLNVFNALNYLNKGGETAVEDAAVEVRKLNNKQKEYLNQYGSVIESDIATNDEDEGEEAGKAYAALKLDPTTFANGKPAKPTEKDIFKDSTTARYLSMLFYMMNDDKDNADLDAKILNAINSSFDTSSELNIASGKGRLDVIAFSDLIGRRGEKRNIYGPIVIPAVTVNTKDGPVTVDVPAFDIEFAYPVFPAIKSEYAEMAQEAAGNAPAFVLKPGRILVTPEAPEAVKSVKIVMDDGTTKELSLLEDFDYAVQQDVNTKARKAYTRSKVRSITKKAASVAAGTVTLSAVASSIQQNPNPLTIKAYGLAYLGVVKAVEAVDMTETADVRQVYALPGKASAAGLELDPGKYSFKVQFLDGSGSVLAEEAYTDVEVKAGVPTLVEATCQD